MNGGQNAPEAGGPSPSGVRGFSPAARGASAGPRLLVAPGPRQAELFAVLTALRPGSCSALAQLYELPAPGARPPLLLLDCDHGSLEDIGWIRNRVAAGALEAVVGLGTDPANALARAVRRLPGSRFAPWPPDLDELRAWLTGAEAPAGAAGDFAESGYAGQAEAPPSAPRATGQRPAPADAAPNALAHAPGSAPTSPLAQVELTPVPRRAPAAPAGGLSIGRDQVAVLADISQRLELAFLALRETGRAAEEDLEGPQIELRRLLRFTRSLACLAAPPPRGVEEFDVSGVIEELLTTLTLRGRKGPRFQPAAGAGGRPAVEFIVRADRSALTLAFETVLGVARLCSSGGDTVKVAYTPINGSAVSIGIEFPAGPLQGVAAENVLDVNVLRERLPDLGPNELAAASAIVSSQGGALEVATPAEGQLAIRMRLPVERSSVPESAPARPARGPRARAEDPFA